MDTPSKRARSMTPEEFIATWKDNPLTERAGAQQWFSDLCDLLGVDKPRDPENYCFARGAKKAAGGQGWADVWKRACFGWENKQPGRPLEAALKQLTDYALNLENPPLLVVADRERIVIHTAFTGYPDEPREIRIEDLIDPQQREILRWVFTDPEKLKPGKSFKAITEEAAARFAALAARMRGRGLEGQRVAHLLVQCLFCLFAEDERLLPENLFADLLKNAGGDTDRARQRLSKLFHAMRDPQGEYGDHDIPWFNGGLFETLDIPPLEADDLAELHTAARDMDWRDIDPTIFGTLFERGLDPKTRAPLGAHYTDVETIGKLIDPVVTQPLLREWATAKAIIQAGAGKGAKTRAYKAAQQAYQGFLLRLYEFRVLDAACGSGNFLYLGLKALRDIEKRVRVEARDLGIHDPQVLLMTGPHNILGLEINEYAAELARVTVWIGDIQWCRRNGYQHATHPILQSLDGIEHRDALLNLDGTEAEWPTADVIVGNPPFLGDKMMRGQLGDSYVETLRNTYAGRVPGGADLVTYWFEKARAQIAAGQCRAAGLVATNSIRGGANRKVLERIVAATLLPGQTGDTHGDGNLRHLETGGKTENGGLRAGTGRSSGAGDCRRAGRTGDESLSGRGAGAAQDRSGHPEMDDRHPAGRGHFAGDEELLLTPVPLRIFNAWSDEPWVNEGAAVRVSLVCFGSAQHECFGADGRSDALSAKPGTSPVDSGAHPDGAARSPRGLGSAAILNGQPVAVIHADLTAGNSSGLDAGCDITQAKSLNENSHTGFIGTQKTGAFDIPGNFGRSWLKSPNPNGRPNSDVVRPWANGMDITRRPSDTWIVDFGCATEMSAAAFYELPFAHLAEKVKTARAGKRETIASKWWLHTRPRPDMRTALTGLSRYLATPRVSKHRYFVWLSTKVLPDSRLTVIAREDDVSFGLLHSRFHEAWSLATCSWHGVGNDPTYNAVSCFETFPFPAGLTPADTVGATRQGSGLLQPAPILPALADPSRRPVAGAIATTAFELNRLREAWLNPPDWVDWVITPEEEQAGFPPRPVSKPGHEADLKIRTLTNLYNARPAWLAMAHEKLDQAVAVAYGWDDYTPAMPDKEILRRLLALNQARAAKP